MVNIGELMYKSFMNGMYQSFIIVGPYIIGPLIVVFIGLAIKKVCEEFTYHFSIVSGDSRRIARKKAKKMSKMIDMISSFKDIIDNTTEQITPDTSEEIIIDRSEDIIHDTPEDNTDNIIINHDYIDNTTNESIDTVMLDENDTVDEVNTKAETASDEIIIEHNTSSADDIVLEHSIDNVTEFDDIVVEHEDTQDPKPEDNKPKKVFDMNVNSANNMKKENKIHEAPKVSKNQNIKVIHNNEKTPYIRKEKQSTQKISFNSEGIKRQGWKEKLDEINRTTSNNEHKVIPRPKGKRKN